MAAGLANCVRFEMGDAEHIPYEDNSCDVKDQQVTFAVRSSALSEDSAQASFAGEFETVLNVHTEKEI